MVCSIRRLRLHDGRLQDVAYEAQSLAEASSYEPSGGVYTVTNTYAKTKVLCLDDHLDRLEDSARRTGIAVSLHRDRLRAGLRSIIEAHHAGDVRFRVTVDPDAPDSLLLSVEDFSPPPNHLIEAGVRGITAPSSAREEARVKSTGWIHARKRLEQAMPEGIYDTFLLDADRYILEGLASNFYAVMDGRLLTAGDGVLEGISRRIVLAVAPNILPVTLEAPHVSQIERFDEAFLTSSSRGIIPVVAIDGIDIADGTPQPYTKALRRAYVAWAEAHLEEL